jgi:thiosulfate/3-mercaptopyruvate sulfurtransferase
MDHACRRPKNVAVLDGGFQKWLQEKRPATIERSALQPREYKGRIDASRLASKTYVLGKIGKSILVDNRTPELFSGMTTEPWALKPGHVKGTQNLPTPWIFQPGGLLKSQSELESMAKGVIGPDKGKEIIAYFCAGPYASDRSYILTELLGYNNVKVYDGSMQEWILDPAGPVETKK